MARLGEGFHRSAAADGSDDVKFRGVSLRISVDRQRPIDAEMGAGGDTPKFRYAEDVILDGQRAHLKASMNARAHKASLPLCVHQGLDHAVRYTRLTIGSVSYEYRPAGVVAT
jgi:hypothetical protein